MIAIDHAVAASMIKNQAYVVTLCDHLTNEMVINDLDMPLSATINRPEGSRFQIINIYCPDCAGLYNQPSQFEAIPADPDWGQPAITLA